jgi:hypothetical protein
MRVSRSRQVETAFAWLFAGVVLLILWQPQLHWLAWPAAALSVGSTLHARSMVTPANRGRRSDTLWVALAVMLVLGGMYAWLAPVGDRTGSMQLAAVLLAVGGVLVWARRRAV